MIGGGIGLVASCDYVIAQEDTIFSLAEVKLGLVPAVIGPFVMRKIGVSWTRALFLTAQRFKAHKAYEIGLVHDVRSTLKMAHDEVVTLVKHVVKAYPNAVKISKTLIADFHDKDFDEQTEIAVKTLAQVRVSDEAQEGIDGFLG